MRIAITGSHGLIARHLMPALRREGHDLLALVRSEAGPSEAHWDPDHALLDVATLAGVDAVVHLAGVGVASRRWNDSHKAAVLDSRVRSTTLLVRTLAASREGPKVLLSASAIGYYGERGDADLDESSSAGTGFLAEVCEQWEAATRPAADAGVRTVMIRTGLVQAGDGGALAPQLPLFKLGLGARIGSGKQWTSWVSIDDEVGAIVHALASSDLDGPLNVVSPNPVTNLEYTKVLARVLRRPALLSVPVPVIKVALGAEMAEQTLLMSQRVHPAALERSGYSFRHPDLEDALEDALGTAQR